MAKCNRYVMFHSYNFACKQAKLTYLAKQRASKKTQGEKNPVEKNVNRERYKVTAKDCDKRRLYQI